MIAEHARGRLSPETFQELYGDTEAGREILSREEHGRSQPLEGQPQGISNAEGCSPLIARLQSYRLDPDGDTQEKKENVDRIEPFRWVTSGSLLCGSFQGGTKTDPVFEMCSNQAGSSSQLRPDQSSSRQEQMSQAPTTPPVLLPPSLSSTTYFTYGLVEMPPAGSSTQPPFPQEGAGQSHLLTDTFPTRTSSVNEEIRWPAPLRPRCKACGKTYSRRDSLVRHWKKSSCHGAELDD